MIREEAIECIEAIHVQMFNSGNSKWTKACDMAIEALQENESLAKSVNEASELLRKKRPHGTWERVDKWVDGKYVGGFIHKECPMIKISDDCLYAPWTYNFCPNCGADMREGDSDA